MSKRKIALVYQAGIANVFEVKAFNCADYGRDARRLLQHAFEPCQWYAQGLAESGACIVRTFACNQAGDIAGALWSTDLDAAPFSNRFRPVTIG